MRMMRAMWRIRDVSRILLVKAANRGFGRWDFIHYCFCMTNKAADHSSPDHLVAGPARALDAHASILPELIEWAAGYVPDGSKLDGAQLAAIFAHSRHLQGLARTHPHIITEILSGRVAEVVTTAMAELEAAASEITEETAMIKAIRQLRQQSALAVALADMA